MGLFNVYIGGTLYKTANTYSISEQAGQSSTATLDVLIESNPIPQNFQRLEIKDLSANPVYTGIIQSVDAPPFSSGFESKRYRITAKDLTVIFDYRIVNDAFQDKTTTEIVDSLFTDILSEENLTKGTIQTFTRNYEVYTSSGLTLRKILDELGDDVGAAATITPAGVFHFVSKENFQEVTPPTNLTDLKKTEIGRGIITIQRLTGANEETSLQSEAVTWSDNAQGSFSTGYQISKISGMTINGSPATVGILGVDEADTGITFLYRYGEAKVSVNSNAAVKPVVTDTVGIVYYGFFSIEIQSLNEPLTSTIASLSGLSGKIEAIAVDTTITNFEDGQNYTDSLLDQKSEAEQTLTCRYTSAVFSHSTLLNLWDLNYPLLSIIGKYVVVERTITDHYDKLLFSVKLKNKNFYSRYGTVLTKNDAQINNLSIRVDDVVFKTSIVSEAFSAVDAFEINQGNILIYPATGSNLHDPSTIPGFYPV